MIRSAMHAWDYINPNYRECCHTLFDIIIAGYVCADSLFGLIGRCGQCSNGHLMDTPTR